MGSLPTIRGFIELKYLCYGNHYSNATDDIEPTLKSLHSQLKRFEDKTFAGHPVKLRTPKHDIYGIAFASHVQHPEGENEGRKKKMTAEEFRDRITKKAKGRFQSFNFKRPNLKPVYLNVTVRMLGAHCRVSLFAGLWRRA